MGPSLAARRGASHPAPCVRPPLPLPSLLAVCPPDSAGRVALGPLRDIHSLTVHWREPLAPAHTPLSALTFTLGHKHLRRLGPQDLPAMLSVAHGSGQTLQLPWPFPEGLAPNVSQAALLAAEGLALVEESR